ncbi:MAG TPA: SPW repeat protein [Micrococcaceae bacterium]|jgi:hypothetical protein
MKKWTRWQDWVAIIAGLVAALSTIWLKQAGASTALMMVFGILLIVCGAINLAVPGQPIVEYAQAAVGLVLFLSPWLGSFATQMGAAWFSWICGAVAVIVTAAAIKPSTEVRHQRIMPSH